MKHGLRPTRKQKVIIKKHGLNPKNWLVIKNLSHELHIAHRHTLTPRIIPLKKKAVA